MFRDWFAVSRRRRQAQARTVRVRSRERIGTRHFERLEERQLLTAYTWTGGATGYWDVANNWSPHAVPGLGAAVSITSSSATVTIQAGDAESISSLTIGANDTLLMTGGSLTTSAGITNGGSITMTGGFIESSPATDSVGNSGFESSLNDWGTWGPLSGGISSLSKQYAYTGSHSLDVSGSNSGVVAIVFRDGRHFVHRVSLCDDSGQQSADRRRDGQLQLLFYNSSGVQISSYSPPNSVVVLTSASGTGGPLAGSVGNQGWNHFSTTAVAPPAGTVSAQSCK